MLFFLGRMVFHITWPWEPFNTLSDQSKYFRLKTFSHVWSLYIIDYISTIYHQLYIDYISSTIYRLYIIDYISSTIYHRLYIINYISSTTYHWLYIIDYISTIYHRLHIIDYISSTFGLAAMRFGRHVSKTQNFCISESITLPLSVHVLFSHSTTYWSIVQNQSLVKNVSSSRFQRCFKFVSPECRIPTCRTSQCRTERQIVDPSKCRTVKLSM
jgi:hypothetical protein